MIERLLLWPPFQSDTAAAENWSGKKSFNGDKWNYLSCGTTPNGRKWGKLSTPDATAEVNFSPERRQSWDMLQNPWGHCTEFYCLNLASQGATECCHISWPAAGARNELWDLWMGAGPFSSSPLEWAFQTQVAFPGPYWSSFFREQKPSQALCRALEDTACV